VYEHNLCFNGFIELALVGELKATIFTLLWTYVFRSFSSMDIVYYITLEFS
jgi:hypothetical protein